VEKLPDDFNMVEIMNKVEERTPYVIVAFQECERMNYLTGEMKRSLKELDLGLKVSYLYKTITAFQHHSQYRMNILQQLKHFCYCIFVRGN
jgi:hypothetical protein